MVENLQPLHKMADADWILYYAKSKDFIWNQVFGEISENEAKEYRNVDSNGRRYKENDLTAPITDLSRKFTWRGVTPRGSRGWLILWRNWKNSGMSV
ncbi:MAG: hypothetical protein OXI08_05935 [Cyanobacteria bacterium MAG IRC4_bin_6]|nr:hypothetical protein [Cyanobacteria bacterium MAG IRC3_bin_20]MDE0647573.1 hypothetical protein [Cyanobacteria bacterium MAG IRC4_bin_6]